MEEFPSFCDHCKSLGHFKKECVSLHPHLAMELTIIHKPVAIVAKKTSRLDPVVDAHPSATSPIVENAIDVGYVMAVSLTLIHISINPDVSLNLVASVDDIGDHIIEQETCYDPMDGSGYYDVSNKEPIINISCSLLFDDALVSLGLEKQHLYGSSAGISIDNIDWLYDLLGIVRNVGKMSIGNYHDL
ncbi:hypothetical protein IEQ34_008362 [Dendrobium chrysotoxum]|uniref:Uncharacterized protein n=1 Tax=Dendrobium chrysotoxum TaxID=161865 RepID=A0AAV7GYZ2_DENCH|nr:hypothetical protein IEQ34_008362 [Dendrobium chrysotoxum]